MSDVYKRKRARSVQFESGYYYAVTDEIVSVHGDEVLEEAYFRTAREMVRDVLLADGKIGKDILAQLEACSDPDAYIDMTVAAMRVRLEVKQELLEEESVIERLKRFERCLLYTSPLHITRYTSIPTTFGFTTGITLLMHFVFRPVVAFFERLPRKLCFWLALIFGVLIAADYCIMIGGMLVTGQDVYKRQGLLRRADFFRAVRSDHDKGYQHLDGKRNRGHDRQADRRNKSRYVYVPHQRALLFGRMGGKVREEVDFRRKVYFP